MKIAFTLARGEATGAGSGLANSQTVSSIPAWAKGSTLQVAFTAPDGGLNPPPTNTGRDYR
jgi:hypothetical protein